MILWGQRLIDKYDILQSNYVTFTALIEEHLETIYETAGTYLRFNDDLRHLSSDDRSIIVRSAADNVSCMSGSFIMQYSVHGQSVTTHVQDLDSIIQQTELTLILDEVEEITET
ncbi:unnamed protein product, partial [Rotaria sp. Silwood2]